MTDTPIAGVRPGDILAGKYRVERVLGEGGMGVVVLAHHLHLDTKVALKFLLPAALANTQTVARFVREARTAVRMTNEHVARVSDVGELPNGAPYMVMEYLDGGDLAGWVEQRGALPISQAVDFILQACVAVADAHALGVVHRDLKPANLFCVRRSDGQLAIKVLDFGISKLTDPAGGKVESLTKTSAVMGTPLYMAPEQMKSAKAVDSRTDIWALGVILFELIAGRSPFLADTMMELAVLITNEPPPPLRSLRPDAPPELEAVILRCVEKDPARRYANVAELARALAPFAPAHATATIARITGIIQAAGLAVSAVELPPHAPPGHSAGTLHAVGRTTGSARNAKPAVIGVAIGALLLLAGASVALFPRKPPEDPTQSVVPTATLASPSVPEIVTASPPPPASEVVTATPSAAPVAPHPAVVAKGTPPARPTVVTPAPSPPTPPVSPTHPAPALSCDPPFTINAAGHRVHKPECP